MDIDESNPSTHQSVSVDQLQCLTICCNWSNWKPLQQIEYFIAVAKIAARKFTDDKRVSENIFLFERRNEPGLGVPKVIDPN